MKITYQVERPKMPFNLFHRKKPEPEQEQSSPAPVEEATPQPTPETTPEQAEAAPEAPVEENTPTQELEKEEAPAQEPTVDQPAQEEAAEPPEEQPPQPQEQPVTPAVAKQKTQVTAENQSKTYLKAMPLKELADIENVETEVKNGNIIILRVTPLAGKSIEDVKTAVNELFQFAESIGGDIARLGEERVVICPKAIRIWREKTPAPVPKREPLPTTA